MESEAGMSDTLCDHRTCPSRSLLTPLYSTSFYSSSPLTIVIIIIIIWAQLLSNTRRKGTSHETAIIQRIKRENMKSNEKNEEDHLQLATRTSILFVIFAPKHASPVFGVSHGPLRPSLPSHIFSLSLIYSSLMIIRAKLCQFQTWTCIRNSRASHNIVKGVSSSPLILTAH